MKTFVLLATGLLKISIAIFVLLISVFILIGLIEYVIEKFKDKDKLPLWK